MKYIKYICMLIIPTLVSACSDDRTEQIAESGYIQLQAASNNMESMSRAVAKPYVGDSPSEDNPLETALWFSTESGMYPNNPQSPTYLPVHTSLTFDGPQMEYVLYNGKNIQYPTDNTPVYCIGLYPNDNEWVLSDDKTTVSHHIDGNTDLMFARPIVGTWTEHFEPMRYEHALTWIKIAACAVSFNALEAWGKLKQISVWSKSTVDIDLSTKVDLIPNTRPDENLEDRYSYTGEGQWIKTLNFSEPQEITSTMDELGSVFCSPDTEYRLKIETVNNIVETTVKLNWLDFDNDDVTQLQIPGRAKGRCFVISLYFHPYNVVTAACTLDKWNIETDDIYLTTE